MENLIHNGKMVKNQVMWAKKENKIIKRYVTLPENYKNYIGFDKMGDEVHIREGFLCVTEQVFDPDLQERGDLVETDGGFTYKVKDKILPPIEKIRAQKLQDFRATFQDFVNTINYCRLIHGVKNTALESVIQHTRQVMKLNIAKIKAFNDPIVLQKFKVQQIDIEALRKKFEPFMY